MAVFLLLILVTFKGLMLGRVRVNMGEYVMDECDMRDCYNCGNECYTSHISHLWSINSQPDIRRRFISHITNSKL